ncbi:MAG: hypothetical protein UY07_C0012G0017 [Parcubacteria group bacterium GW2011_GWA1_47_8]|nr:MAG: hypothetical protein UY07_C0012G0017 [Parcubacteria group bacterium GW2011_GWA1_47_8]KKW07741.1 MAG: hypothetical protein UY42_C0007G0008 [Parcubacteria group bacterium GW2011_GWA2_49_16]
MKYQKKKFLSKGYGHARGFTLIEVLVAITILLIAVVGPISLIGGSLAQIRIARQNAVAVNLAQEGIEAVRQLRDSNMVYFWNGGPCGGNPNTKWRRCPNDLDPTNNYYIVTMSTPSSLVTNIGCSSTSSASCLNRQIVCQNNFTKVFVQRNANSPSCASVSGVKTPFWRRVEIQNVSGGGNREIRVTSTVTWKPPGSAQKTVTITESLFGISAPN